MAPVKRVDRSATICYSPAGPYLATGSVAGAIDLSFSTSSVLEIFDVDLGNQAPAMRLAGPPVQAPERFARLSWSKAHGPYRRGIIAGGLSDGSIMLWDAAKLLRRPGPQSSPDDAVLARFRGHAGPVRGLEFAPTSPNLLASGGADGDLLVWDVTDASHVQLLPPLSRGAPAGAAPAPAPAASAAPPPPGDAVSHLQWNRKVAHVLCTVHQSGTVKVWDLRKRRLVIAFRDEGGAGGRAPARASAVAWNPEVATQLLLASDDDARPQLTLWDLRNARAPVRELAGHRRGVAAVAWCPHDPRFALSAGKDGRVLVWDVASSTPCAELEAGADWAFDASWSPRDAGLVATATFEGEVLVLATDAAPPAPEAAGRPRPAPAWLAPRAAAATWAFGGKIARGGGAGAPGGAGPGDAASVVSGASGADAAAAGGPDASLRSSTLIEVLQYRGDRRLAEAAASFREELGAADAPALLRLCRARAEAADAGPDAAEADLWAFLAARFEDDPRAALIELLGLREAEAARARRAAEEAEEAEAAHEEVAAGEEAADAWGQDGTADAADVTADGPYEPPSNGLAHLDLSNEGADGFFDDPASPQVADVARVDDSAPEPQAGPGPAAAPTPSPAPTSPLAPPEPGADEGTILAALRVGDPAGAAEAAIAAGRFADAVVLGSLAGGRTWERARDAYLRSSRAPFARVAEARVSGDWAALAAREGARGGDWRGTLALLLSSCPPEELPAAAAALAASLESSGSAAAATLVRVAVGDLDAAAEAWSREVSGSERSSVRPAAGGPPSLQRAVELSLVLALGVGRAPASPPLAALLSRYADALAASGRLELATGFLRLVAQDEGGEGGAVEALLERALGAGSADAAAGEGGYGAGGEAAGEDDRGAVSYAEPATNGYPAATSPTTLAAHYPARATAQRAHGAAGPASPAAPTALAQAAGPPGAYQPQAYVPTSFAPPTGPPSSFAPPTGPPSSFAPPTGPAQPAYQPLGYEATRPAAYEPAAPYAPAAYEPAAYEPAAPYAPAAYEPAAYEPAAPYAPPAYEPAAYEPAAYEPAPYVPAPREAQPYQRPPPAATYGAPAAGGGYGPPAAALELPAGSAPPASPARSHATPTAARTFAPQPPAQTFGAAPPQAAVAYAPDVPPPYAPAAPPAPQPASKSSGPVKYAPGAFGVTPSREEVQPAAPRPPERLDVLEADVSAVAPELQHAAAVVVELFRWADGEATAAAGGVRPPQMADASSRLGKLLWQLNAGLVSDSVAGKLARLCAALEQNDAAGVSSELVSLTSADWDEARGWLPALKRLIKTRQAAFG